MYLSHPGGSSPGSPVKKFFGAGSSDMYSIAIEYRIELNLNIAYAQECMTHYFVLQ